MTQGCEDFTMKMIAANPVHFHRSGHDLGCPERSATFFRIVLADMHFLDLMTPRQAT
jgi:hypothetical protein